MIFIPVYHDSCPVPDFIGFQNEGKILFLMTIQTLTFAQQDTYTHTNAAAGTPSGGTGIGESAGKCAMDQFQIVGAAMTSPVICGANAAGQHSKYLANFYKQMDKIDGTSIYLWSFISLPLVLP